MSGPLLAKFLKGGADTALYCSERDSKMLGHFRMRHVEKVRQLDHFALIRRKFVDQCLCKPLVGPTRFVHGSSLAEDSHHVFKVQLRAIVRAESLWAAIVGATVLAVLVNVIELVCTAGLPALYTQVLVQQGVSVAGRYAYLALYILAYMLDDAIMVGIAVVTLGRRKLQERAGRWLKLLSGVVVLTLGLLLIFAPAALVW